MSIRTLFSARRPIDRPIEKVIDYYATDEKRLLAEIEEYEVTDNVEVCFVAQVECRRGICSNFRIVAGEAKRAPPPLRDVSLIIHN